MKRIFNHPAAPQTGRKYWRTVEEFADTPEFRAQLEQEFPRGASEFNGGEVSRRSFLQLMGASVALAGVSLTGCRRPELDIVPYSRHVEWQIPGKFLSFATSMPRRGGALPLLATSYNGRPTKLEGNPGVSGFNGSTDVFGQAAILDLYDPDRSKSILKAIDRGSHYEKVDMAAFHAEMDKIKADYADKHGQGLAILAEPSTSPTRAFLRAELTRQFPHMIWAEFDPWSLDNVRDGLGGNRPVYHLDKADVIVSFESDFLGTNDGNVQNIAGFAAGRRRLGHAQETMSRLYVVESHLSITGGMADHRLRMPSSNISGFITLLANKLGINFHPELTNQSFQIGDPKLEKWLEEVAAELINAKGRSLVMVGSQQAPGVHAMAAYINATLNNAGQTVSYIPYYEPGLTTPSRLAELNSQLTAGGSVKTLIILGGNPAFTSPVFESPGIQYFADSVKNVDQVIHLGFHVDETAALSTMHVPMAHFLETWGDSRAYDGTYLCQQPLILPLWDGISEIDLLAELAGLPAAKGAEHIQNSFRQVAKLESNSGKVFEDAWHQFVHDGFLAGSAPAEVNLQTSTLHDIVVTELIYKPLDKDQKELTFVLGNIDDGRYANNGWLQELPDPVSKLTWENALYVSIETAKELGLEPKKKNILGLPESPIDLPYTDFPPDDADAGPWSELIARDHHTTPLVTIKIHLGDIQPNGDPKKNVLVLDDVPVLIAPGQASRTITLALGWGRTAPRLTEEARSASHSPLRVAVGGANADLPAGVNAYALRYNSPVNFIGGVTDEGGGKLVNRVEVVKNGRYTSVAVAQEHNSMEGRGIVREASLAKYHENPEFVQEIGVDKETPQGELKGYQNYESAYTTPALNSAKYQPERPAWGMTIDLNTCVGCNTCMVACQAENNIPVVGKWQVIRGREMHWIRLDRYFGTDVSHGEPANSDYLKDDPQMLFQPMACQQCEIAPCEPVCPVNATVHNEEGLNVMAYNRCIGTRYCANNCPYKARRFNFFNYNDRPIQNVKLPVLGETGELYLGPLAGKDGPLTYKGSPDTIALQKNPNVSVRIRGVMEKCTYCVQRIEEAKINQLRVSKLNAEETAHGGSDQITLPTDSVKAACQQACPAEAIVFGNLNDANSKVAANKKDERNYGVLAYLGTRPRTSYLGRVRNPNPKMDGSASVGHTSKFNDETAPVEVKGASK